MEWQVMLRFEVEMVMMQVIVEMVVHHVFDVISMKMMLVLHMVQHIVAMIIKMNAMTLNDETCFRYLCINCIKKWVIGKVYRHVSLPLPCDRRH